MELNEYTNKKESLLKNLQRLQIIADDLGLTNQTKEIEKNIIQLNHEHFELVVVGEFSRGKSTFINAMLGRRILPSSKKPTTTMISKIVYSEEPSYSLFYKSGKVKKLDEKTFISITASNVASKELPIDKFENLKSYLNIKGKEDLNKIYDILNIYAKKDAGESSIGKKSGDNSGRAGKHPGQRRRIYDIWRGDILRFTGSRGGVGCRCAADITGSCV